jgi:GxxExxY protein
MRWEPDSLRESVKTRWCTSSVRLGLPSRHNIAWSFDYDGIVVGDYTVDLLVEHIVLVELKVAKAIDEIHRAQCLNYLKATGLHLSLLLNFGRPRLEIKRIVLDL